MKLILFIASIGLVSALLCSCVTHQQKYYKIEIHDEWPEHIKTFFTMLEQWLQMDMDKYEQYVEKMDTKKFESNVKYIYSYYSFNPQHHANRGYEIPKILTPLKSGTNIMLQWNPVSLLMRRVENNYSLKDRLIIEQPILTYIRVTNNEKVPFPCWQGKDTIRVTQFRITCEILDIYKGKVEKGKSVVFWYMDTWEDYAGVPNLSPVFKVNQKYVLFLTYREEAHEAIYLDKPSGPITLALDVWRRQEDGVFTVSDNSVEDPLNFFGYGEKIPLDSFKIKINEDISKWKF